ncbi:hypothetical protein Pint_09518 [Pistacia integerrima]|uniref:Uncharacterized protein n=1 Tax=Pistacia integerrima TaxID=434235 RepID=A0ACC0XL73_9ROSI|nr:hypothetical protein Pint_09518 [Pistacia integerrima]
MSKYLAAEALSRFLWSLRNSKLFGATDVSDSFCEEKYDLYYKINCTSIDNTWHITAISLSSVHLDGYIDPVVKNLTYLEILDLSRNDLEGPIPHELGSLSHLTDLDLAFNKLTGSIPPSLGNLKSLTKLAFSYNQLTGPIPELLGNLKMLEALYLFNNFLNGSIPPSLGNLSSLELMYLAYNRLSGSIPVELGELGKLERLDLKDNELNGSLPKELGKLSNLRTLYLSSNYFTGNLPEEYQNITTMESFHVAGNYLTGPFPKFVVKWVNLLFLDLGGNNFEDELPPEIFTMTNLQTLRVSDLNHTGFQLQKSINLTNMYTLVLRNCNIIGQIPPFISAENSMSLLDLSFNKFTGVIPDYILNLEALDMFLSGDVINQTTLRWINNSLRGNLQFIVNQITGNPLYQIMDNRCGREKSKYDSLFINAGGERIKFDQNDFDEDTSTLLTTLYENSTKPWAYSCFGDFLWSPDSTNYIQNINPGEAYVPEIYFKARVCPQSLTYYGFCLHNGNYNVKLYFAEIVFAKEENYSRLGKRVFDIYIQGNPVRRDLNIKAKAGSTPNNEWIENFTDISVHDNLLEIRLFWAGKGSILHDDGDPFGLNGLPVLLNGPIISAISVTRNIKPLPIAWIVVASVLTALLLLVLVLAFMWRMGCLGDRELRVTKVELRGQSYTIKQVKDATRNFSPKNKIGKGRFGMIYKACVLHSGQMLLNLVDTNLCGDYDKKQALKILDLAIKCINLSPTLRPTMLEIVSELEQISNVNAPSPSA